MKALAFILTFALVAFLLANHGRTRGRYWPEDEGL